MIEPCFFADEVSRDFEEAVRLGAEAGATAIELRGGIWGRAVQSCTDEDVARMQQVLAAHGARVAVIGSPVGKCALDDDEECRQHLEWFDRMCELAHRFGARVIRGFAFWAPRQSEGDRPDLSPYLDRITERLAPITKRAEAEDVLYCLETEGSTMTGTCAEIAAVIEALGGSGHLGATWDVNNGWDCGELPLPDGYAHVRGRVHHVHVKPNARKSIETVADSPVAYAQVVRALRADGYAGFFGVEHWGSPELMLEGVRQVKALLSQDG